MTISTKFLSWVIVIASFLLIFLPVQIASPSLSNIIMFIIGVLSLGAQLLVFARQEKTTANNVQLILVMVLTVVAMILMYFMPSTF